MTTFPNNPNDSNWPIAVGDSDWGRKLNHVLNGFFRGMIGSMRIHGGLDATIPSGWLKCDGSSLLIADYPELYAVIGTSFGSADASHFSLPDMTGRFPTQGTLGDTGGTNTINLSHTHTIGHTHNIAVVGKNDSTLGDSGGVNDATGSGVKWRISQVGDAGEDEFILNSTDGYNATATGVSAGSNSTNSGSSLGSTSVRNPYLGVNFIIYASLPISYSEF